MVPKKSEKVSGAPERSWRLSFPGQEKKRLLEGPGRQALKPLIRLLKASFARVARAGGNRDAPEFNSHFVTLFRNFVTRIPR